MTTIIEITDEELAEFQRLARSAGRSVSLEMSEFKRLVALVDERKTWMKPCHEKEHKLYRSSIADLLLCKNCGIRIEGSCFKVLGVKLTPLT